jgi:hypothetical protein
LNLALRILKVQFGQGVPGGVAEFFCVARLRHMSVAQTALAAAFAGGNSRPRNGVDLAEMAFRPTRFKTGLLS